MSCAEKRKNVPGRRIKRFFFLQPSFSHYTTITIIITSSNTKKWKTVNRNREMAIIHRYLGSNYNGVFLTAICLEPLHFFCFDFSLYLKIVFVALRVRIRFLKLREKEIPILVYTFIA